MSEIKPWREYIGKHEAYMIMCDVLNALCEKEAIKKTVYVRLRQAPSTDAVQVVRCGQCEHWKCNPTTNEYGVCNKVSYDEFEVVMDSDDFCSYGRKESE